MRGDKYSTSPFSGVISKLRQFGGKVPESEGWSVGVIY